MQTMSEMALGYLVDMALGLNCNMTSICYGS